MTIKNNICNKISSRVGKNNLIVLFLILLLILISSAVFAIPDSLTLQGKLTNLGGTAQTGTFNFTFKIYDAYTGGNVLWKDDDRDITTDANGIYDVILYNLSALNFSEQYYLGITVSTDNESKPRINLTSSPYSFRANISEDLNKENAYTVAVFNITGNLTIGESFADTLTVTTGRLNISDGNIISAGNLTLGEKISFSLGSIIDNLVSGFLRISSGLNVTGNVSIAQDTLFVDNTSNRVGIGTTNPNYKLDVVGSINATNINATGIIQATTFLGDGGSLTGISTGQIWNSSGSNVFLNDTTGSVGIGTSSPRAKLDINGTGPDNLFMVGNASNDFFVINGTTGRVGINTSTPQFMLEVNGTISAWKINTVIGIDPVYDINGTKYPTWSVSSIGIREELKGIAELDDSLSYTIDFTAEEKGSDAWLFWKIIGKKTDDISVSLTPNFDGNVWYSRYKNKLTFFGSKQGEISFQLSAPRFDDGNWTRIADQDLRGLKIE